MLKAAVLKTIQYFDVQDHCLTLLDISKYLLHIPEADGRVFSLSEIQTVLDRDLSGEVQGADGFYFLRGRKELVQKRLQNNFYASKRLKRAKRFLPGVRHVPFIASVSLGGSEAISNSKQGSDIDLLIITKPNRMWLGRLAITVYFQLLGMRRHGKYVADRFCLNHYIAAPKTLDADQNIYTAIEYISQIPYFGGEVFYQFLQNNLGWFKKYLHQPLFELKETPPASAFKLFLEKLFSAGFGNWLENLAGKYQLSRIEIQDYITVEPDELSFHPGSKGQRVLKKAGI